MQNTSSYHSTTPWSCTAAPESEPEMFELFNNNKKVALRNGIFLQVWSRTAIPFASFHTTIIQEKHRREAENKP